MKKSLIIPLLIVIALMLYVMPVAASSWDVKVTGGGLATAGSIEFSITASAKQDLRGVTGQMQYSRTG